MSRCTTGASAHDVIVAAADSIRAASTPGFIFDPPPIRALASPSGAAGALFFYAAASLAGALGWRRARLVPVLPPWPVGGSDAGSPAPAPRGGALFPPPPPPL